MTQIRSVQRDQRSGRWKHVIGIRDSRARYGERLIDGLNACERVVHFEKPTLEWAGGSRHSKNGNGDPCIGVARVIGPGCVPDDSDKRRRVGLSDSAATEQGSPQCYSAHTYLQIKTRTN